MNVTIVTLNDPDDWADHKSLYEKIFKNYEAVKVIDKNNFKVDNDNYYKNDILYIKDDVYIMLKDQEKDSISFDINLNKLPKYENDENVGTIKIKLNDKLLKEVNIYVKKQEEIKAKKSLWQKIIGWFKHDK